MEPGFAHRHLFGIEQLSARDIELVLQTAAHMRKTFDRPIKKAPTLRGRTVFNLFFEDSTRTKTSFELAAKRLSADSVNFAVKGSSVNKGETLQDTVLTLDAMQPDLIIVRHKSSGVPQFIAKHVKCSVINAGDGTHEHPTQALLDALTILDRKPELAGLTVTIVGDILHSRVARSNLLLLARMGATVRLCGPRTLLPPEFAQYGATIFHDLDPAIDGADVVMMLRVQLERQTQAFFPDLREYATQFCLTSKRLKRAKKDVVVMHPGPMNRGIEIAADVADGAASVVLYQVQNGVFVRMALMYLLLGAGSLEA